MSEEKKLTLEDFKYEMRDLSGYTPADLDVRGFLINELDQEIEVMGKPYDVRVYPTPYMMTLVTQVKKLDGSPAVLDQNYKSFTHKGFKVFVGCNTSDEFVYIEGNALDKTVKTTTSFSAEDRTEKILLNSAEVYRSLAGENEA